MTSEDDRFEYICNVKTIFEFMQNEIDFSISNKLELVTDFIIRYKSTEFHINIWNNMSHSKNKIENKIDIMLNEEHYNNLEEFKNNAKLNGILIKDIKENIKVIVTHGAPNYLEEHQIINNKPIKTKQFKAPKSLCDIFLFSSIFFIIFAILTRWLFKGQKGAIVGHIIFDSIALLCTYVYIYYKRKKVIYKDKSFIKYGIFSKKTYLVSDIEFAEEKMGDIIITFKNNKKVLIGSYMTNSTYAKRILQQNNVKIIKN